MAPSLKYGLMEDGEPFVCSDKEAWAFSGGLWKRERLPEVGMNGRVMSKEAFDARFSSRPALPSSALHSGSADKTSS
jgi:hypothetical protein